MKINANTKIGTILKSNAAALEAIVAISPKFGKLRNPLLRKIMAPRVSIEMAAKVGGCSVNDFFIALQPLGFESDKIDPDLNQHRKTAEVPAWIHNKNRINLDVRPLLKDGKDPLEKYFLK